MTLTREQILSMGPGPKLNELVALNVMGYEKSRMQDGFVRRGSHATYPKLYSTDISAAWEVVDKLKYIQIIPQSIGAPENMKYLARIEQELRIKDLDVFAATAPEAISKAALLYTLEDTE